MDCRSGLCTHFITRLCLRLTLSHTLTQNSTSTPFPEPERHCFTPKKAVTRVSLEVGQSPLLPPEAGLNSNPGSHQSDEWGSQVGSRAFLGSFVQLELASLAHQEKGSLSSDQYGWPSWQARDAELAIGR
jgi:hypothetical protein